MRHPILSPPIADEAPTAAEYVTDYDREHMVIYLRLLDADAEDGDGWKPARVRQPGRQTFES